MEDGFLDIRIRDGWALILLLGIGGLLAWNCQSESRFSFFMNVSLTGSKSSAPRRAELISAEMKKLMLEKERPVEGR